MKRSVVVLVAILCGVLDVGMVTAAERASEFMRDPFAVPFDTVPIDSRRNPLRRYPLAKLRLVATIFGISSPRALIEDPTGLGFVIGVGDVLGVEKARVTRIEPGRLHVESSLTTAGRVTSLMTLRSARSTPESE